MKGLRKMLHNTALVSIAVFINLLALVLFIELYKKNSSEKDGTKSPLVSVNKISTDVKIPIKTEQTKTVQKETKHNPRKVEATKESKKTEPVKTKQQSQQRPKRESKREKQQSKRQVHKTKQRKQNMAPAPKKQAEKKKEPPKPLKTQTGAAKIAVGTEKHDGKPIPNITPQTPDAHKDLNEKAEASPPLNPRLERNEAKAKRRAIHQQSETSETFAQRTAKTSVAVKSEVSQNKDSQKLAAAGNKNTVSVSRDKSRKNPVANVNEGMERPIRGTNASVGTRQGQPARNVVRAIRASRLHNAYRGRLVRAGMQGLTSPDGVKAPALAVSPDVDRMMLRQFGFKLVAYCNVDEELKLRFVIDPNTGDYTPLKKDKSVTYSKRGIGVSRQSFPLLYGVAKKIADTHNILSDDITFFYLVPLEIDAYIYAKQMQMVKAAFLDAEDPRTLTTHGEWYVGNGKLMLIINEIETAAHQFISVRDFERQY